MERLKRQVRGILFVRGAKEAKKMRQTRSARPRNAKKTQRRVYNSSPPSKKVQKKKEKNIRELVSGANVVFGSSLNSRVDVEVERRGEIL